MKVINTVCTYSDIHSKKKVTKGPVTLDVRLKYVKFAPKVDENFPIREFPPKNGVKWALPYKSVDAFNGF